MQISDKNEIIKTKMSAVRLILITAGLVAPGLEPVQVATASKSLQVTVFVFLIYNVINICMYV